MSYDAGAIESTLTLDRNPFQAGLRSARAEGKAFTRNKFAATLDGDHSGFTRAVNAADAAGRRFAGKTYTATVTARSDTREVEQFAAAVKALPNRKTMTLNAKVTGADTSTTALVALEQVADRLDGRTIRLRTSLDGAPLILSELGAIDIAAGRLDGRTLTMRGAMDDGGMLTQLAGVETAASAVDGRTVTVNGNHRGLDAIILKLGTIITLASTAGIAGAGGLAALGAGAVAVAPGLGAAALGFMGVSGAVKAMADQQDKAASSGAKAAGQAQQQARQQAQAARRVQDAREAAAESVRNAADGVQTALAREEAAERAVARAVTDRKRVAEQAGESVQAAIRAELRARNELNESYKTARERIIDLQFETVGGALAQRRAVLNLQRANEDLAKAQAAGIGGRELEEYRLAVDEATLAVDRQKVANRRTAEEKADSDRRGVAGSKEVTAAQERLTESTKARERAERDAADRIQAADERVADARRQAADASAGVAKAQAALVKAQRDGIRRVADALDAQKAAAEKAGTASAASVDKVAEAMEKLTPAGRRFARFIYGLEPTLDRLRGTAQAGFLPGLQDGIDRLLSREDEINNFVDGYASAMGRLFADTGAELQTQEWTEFFDWLDDQATPSIKLFGDITGNAIGGTLQMLRAASPLWYEMGGAIADGTATFHEWAKAAEAGDSPGFNEFLDNVRTYGPVVWDTIVDLTAGAWHLAESLAPVGATALEVVGAFARIIESTPAPVLIAITSSVLAAAAAWKILKAAANMSRTWDTAATALGRFGISLDGSTKKTETGERRTRGFSGALGKIGMAVPIAGAALVALELGLDAVNTSSSEAADALMKGGDAAKNMSAELKAQDDDLDRIEQQFGSGVRAVEEWVRVNISGQSTTKSAREEIEKQRAAMSDLERAQSIATEKQNDLAAAQEKYGPASKEAADAADLYEGALREVSVQSAKVKYNVDETTAAIYAQRDAMLESADANLRKRQADLDAADAQKRYNDAVRDNGPKSEEAAQAQIELEQAQLRAAEAARAGSAGQKGYNDTVAAFVRDSKGPMSETLQSLIRGLDGAGLSAIGAKVDVDETGKAVLRLPDGRTVDISVENSAALAGLGGVAFAVASVPAGKTIHMNALTEPEKQKLRDLGFVVDTLPDGTVNVTANDAEARATLIAFQQYAAWQSTPTGLSADPAEANRKMGEFLDNARKQVGLPGLSANPAEADRIVGEKLDQYNRSWGTIPVKADTQQADKDVRSWWQKTKDFIGGVFQDLFVPGAPRSNYGNNAAGGLVGYYDGGVLPRLAGGGTSGPGGLLVGPGTGTSDSIMARDPATGAPTAMVSNGEYVVRKRAVDVIGVPTLDRLNALAGGGTVLARYAAGGGISAAAAAAATGAGATSAAPAVPIADPAATADAAAATDQLTAAMTAADVAAAALDPTLSALAATQAGVLAPAQDAVTAGQKQLVAAGVLPLQAALNGVLAPALTAYGQQVGVAAPAANTALQAAQAATRTSTAVTAANTAAAQASMAQTTTASAVTQQAQHSAVRQSQGQSVLANDVFAANTAVRTRQMAGDTTLMQGTVSEQLRQVRGSQGTTVQSTQVFADAWRAQLARTQPDSANPLRWVINFPIRSITDAWNNLDAQFALGKRVNPYIANFAGGGQVYPAPYYAAGGRVTGGIPGRDSVPSLLMPGEVVWSKQAVDNVGGPDVAQAMHRDARTGVLASAADSLGVPMARRDAGMLGMPMRFAEGGLVAFGRRIQAMGYDVGSHPAFGGISWGAHGKTSLHYSGQAIDVNKGAGTSPQEQAALSQIVPLARQYGLRTIFMSPGHYNHAHFDTARSPDIIDAGAGLGMGMGMGGFDFGQMVTDAFAKAYTEVGDVTRFFGGSPQVVRDQGVARVSADRVREHATTKMNEMFAMSATSGVPDTALANLIIGIGKAMGFPRKGAEVALVTAFQESGLRNINYGDRDSLGIFQQRPSMGWGTPAQIMNPRYSTAKFYDTLRGVRGWEGMPHTVAAQRVQRSAFPDAYAKWVPQAVGLVSSSGIYDNGGEWPAGTAGFNLSGGTEQVLTSDQRDALTRRLNRDETRGGSGGGSAELLAALEAMAARIETAVARARGVTVNPRERQSEESIAWSLLRIEDREQRLAL